MRKAWIILIIGIPFYISSCNGNKADGEHGNVKQKSTITYDDSVRTAKEAPPKDSTMADSTTNAPKMSGQ